MNKVTVLAPATVANFVCGFDILGFALSQPLDRMVVRLTPNRGVVIKNIDQWGLPADPLKNVSGVALLALLEKVNEDVGFEIESDKTIKPGSGLGSSAASAVAAVVGANWLLGSPFTSAELIQFALAGEELASGSRHADNIAPCLLGGITLVRSSHGPDIVQLQGPPLSVTVLHPQIEVKTSEARALLKKEIPLKDAVVQWGNVAGLVAGLQQNDYGLISRSLTDVVAEPARSALIPHFHRVKTAALAAGALGGGISGSGPAVFMLSRDEATAKEVELAIISVYKSTGIEFKTYVASTSRQGARIIEDTGS